ncbi:hypothetical protein Tco_0160446, partial [Tanacetum coccineum]
MVRNIIPQIVTQVTTNVNNANGGNGNGGNDGCSYKIFTSCNPKEFDGKGGAVALLPEKIGIHYKSEPQYHELS